MSRPEEHPANLLPHSPHPEASVPPGGTTPEFFNRVYTQLRDLAHARMAGESANLTLQTTALVHEVYLRLMQDPETSWANPRHFFGAAAEAMRRILIERARRYATHKRGIGRRRVALEAAGDDAAQVTVPFAADNDSAEAMLALDNALTELKSTDPQLGEVVMLRYFAGLSVDETASATGRSSRSVKRDWSFARAWLARRLQDHA